MKKFAVLALFAALAPAFSGCGVDQPGGSGAAAAPSPAAAPAANPEPVAVPASGLAVSEPVPIDHPKVLNEDCNVEGVDGILFAGQPLPVSGKGQHEISGWIVDLERKAIPADLQLVVTGVSPANGTWTASHPKWIDRAGVAQTRGYGPELANSGFSFAFDSSTLAPGTYHVFVMSKAGGRVAVCDPGRQISIGS